MKQFNCSSFEPAQQGQLDALCGVYAAANFLFRRCRLPSDCEERWDIFKNLLDNLSSRGKFTVSHVCQDGFSGGQIQAAFNKTARDLCVNVKAHQLGPIMRRRMDRTPYGIVADLQSDEAVMLRVDDRSHWIIVHSANNGRLILDDGYPPSRSRKILKSDKRLKGVDIQDGLASLNA